MYNCNCCSYNTKRQGNYLRHLKSKLHFKKVKQDDKSKSIRLSYDSHTTPKLGIKPDIFECKYCYRKFTRGNNLGRHQKYCKEKQNIEKEYKGQINVLNGKVSILSQEKNREKTFLTNELNHYKEEVKYYRYLLEEAGGMVKKSISSATYIQQKYVNAPSIKPLSIKDLKGLEQDKVKLAHNILYTYRHDTIDRYIGDQIIAVCLTTNPYKQFIWNTDSSRFTYMIRTVVDKVSIWQVDKGGRETARFLIDPILNEIKQLMLDHYKTKCQIKEGDDAEKCIQIAKDSNTILDIIEHINDNVINDKILRYITPPLTFRKDLIK
jgi:hypothetical protein